MGKQLWTREEVINRIRNLNEAGQDLVFGNVAALAPRLVAAASRYFGSWGRAVQEAGIDHSELVRSSRERASEKRSKWSNARIVERVRELASSGESLEVAVVSLKHADVYRAACSTRYFGGWSRALEAAGIHLESKKPGQPTQHSAALAKWKSDLLLERIRQVSGPEGTIDEHSISALAPALYEAVVKRFGSWEQALAAMENKADADHAA